MKNATKNTIEPSSNTDGSANEKTRSDAEPTVDAPQKPVEIGGSKKPEPTRYGDWEIGGKCVDF